MALRTSSAIIMRPWAGWRVARIGVPWKSRKASTGACLGASVEWACVGVASVMMRGPSGVIRVEARRGLRALSREAIGSPPTVEDWIGPEDRMPEAEVALRLAEYLSEQPRFGGHVEVAIDGASVRVHDADVFDIVGYLQSNGWVAVDGTAS